MTPQRQPGVDEYSEYSPKELEALRRGLTDRLGCGKDINLPYLMRLTGLAKDFKGYLAKTADVDFEGLATKLPAINSAASSGARTAKSAVNEKTFTRAFMAMLNSLSVEAKKVMPAEYASTPYDTLDCQDMTLGQTGLKPDLAFYPRGELVEAISDVHFVLEAKQARSSGETYRKHLGQMAHYALELKKSQPLRSFVPVLFLQGCDLDILVFTHAGLYRAPIGPVLCHNDNDKVPWSARMARSLQHLWFLLTLPLDKFGLLNRLPLGCYVEIAATTTSIQIIVDSESSSEAIEIVKRIPRDIPIVGRCTYIFEAKYKGKAAIFKMTWIRADRLAEGAVYDVLGERAIPGVPKVYQSGILVKDLNGYRLEFVLMEHCGTPILGHFAAISSNYSLASTIGERLTGFVKQVASTLVEAHAAGVLHRDISAGNIAIRGGQAFVIDWGCAKIVREPAESLKKSITERWSVDWEDMSVVEQAKDPFTGTPLYMSVQMLLGVPERGIFNDLESLFYVALDCLSSRPRRDDPKNVLPGFAFNGSEFTAFARIGILACDGSYLRRFGVLAVNPSPEWCMLEAMRRFLFFKGAVFIGGKLDGNYQREVNETAALGFMDSATVHKLVYECNAGQGLPHSPQLVHSADLAKSASGTPGPVAPTLAPPPKFSLEQPVISAENEDRATIQQENAPRQVSQMDISPEEPSPVEPKLARLPELSLVPLKLSAAKDDGTSDHKENVLPSSSTSQVHKTKTKTSSKRKQGNTDKNSKEAEAVAKNKRRKKNKAGKSNKPKRL